MPALTWNDSIERQRRSGAHGICGRSRVQGSPDSRSTPSLHRHDRGQLRSTPLNESESSHAGDDEFERSAPTREDSSAMRRLFSCSLAWLFLVILAGMTRRGRAGPMRPSPRSSGRFRRASPASSGPDEADGVLERGLDQERSRNWAGGHRDLSRGPRALAQPRRFQPPPPALRDPFQAEPPLLRRQLPNILLRLPHDQAVELYDEVLERIQSNYVDPVPLEPWSATASTTSRSPSATRSSSRPTRRRRRPSA